MSSEVERKAVVNEELIDAQDKLFTSFPDLKGNYFHIDKKDYYFKNPITNKSFRVRIGDIGHQPIFCYKNKKTVGDTEVNEEYEIKLNDDIRALKDMFNSLGLFFIYSKEKIGIGAYKEVDVVDPTGKLWHLKYHIELFTLISETAQFCRNFIEIECTGRDDVPVETINDGLDIIFDKLGYSSSVVTEPYEKMILGE